MACYHFRMNERRAALISYLLSIGGLSIQAGPVPQPLKWSNPTKGVPNLARFSQAVIQRWGADYIRISYFIDPEGLKKRTAEDAITWLRNGRVWSGTQLTFMTGISSEKRRSVFDAQFKQLWPHGQYDPQRPTLKRFFEATARRLERGDRLDYLLDPTGAVMVRHGKEPWTVIKDRELMLSLLALNYVDGPDNAATIQAIARDLERFSLNTP